MAPTRACSPLLYVMVVEQPMEHTAPHKSSPLYVYGAGRVVEHRAPTKAQEQPPSLYGAGRVVEPLQKQPPLYMYGSGAGRLSGVD